MNAELPPKIVRLLDILKESNSVAIAERMICSWLNGSDIRGACHSSESDGETACTCGVLRAQLASAPASYPCKDFHWSCFLLYLSGVVLRVMDSSEEVVDCPRFCLLPGLAQINLLTLLLRMYRSIPTRTITNFLMVVKHHLATDSWEGYLCRKLLLQTGASEEKKTLTLEGQRLQAPTALQVTTIDKIREVCQQHFHRLTSQVALKPLASVMGCNSTHSNSAHSDRKRPRETASDENCEGEAEAKRYKSSDDRMVTVTSCKENKANVNKGDVPELGVAAQSVCQSWQKGEVADQSQFDAFAALSLDEFHMSITAVTETELQLVALRCVLQNLLNCEVDIAHPNLTVLYRDLICPELLSLEEPLKRDLQAMLSAIFGRDPPTVIVNGLLVPLVTSPKFGTHQGQALARLTLSKEHRNLFWQSLVCLNSESNSASDQFIWNDNVAVFLLDTVKKGIDLEEIAIPHLLHNLSVNVSANSKSLKLADLLLLFLSLRYGPKLISSGCETDLRKIVDSIESPKKKILIKVIDKLCS